MKLQQCKTRNKHLKIELPIETIRDLSNNELGALVKLLSYQGDFVPGPELQLHFKTSIKPEFAILQEKKYVHRPKDRFMVFTAPVDKPKSQRVVLDFTEDYQEFLCHVNRAVSRHFKGDSKSIKNYKVSRETFTQADILKAVANSVKDPYHIEKKMLHLTPEFLSRGNIINRYMNYSVETKGGFVIS